MDLINKIFKGDKVIWGIFIILCLISIVEGFSAGSRLTYQTNDYLAPILNHSRFILAGFLIALITQYIPPRLFRYAGTFGTVIAIMLLIATLLFGKDINGAQRWFFGIQPSEVAKACLVCSIGFILHKMHLGQITSKKAFYSILAVSGIICILIFKDNLSTVVLIITLTLSMMFVGKIKTSSLLKTVLALLLVGILGLLSIMALPSLVEPDNVLFKKILPRMVTWKNRITNFNDDKQISAIDFVKANEQRGAANIAIAKSGILGSGPGNSTQREMLSHAYSDFIFAIIVEELGLLGAGFVASLYILLLIRIGLIAKRVKDDPFSTFTILGIGLLLVIQAIVNMMVAVAILPVTGQPLPLISKGGTSILITSALIGIVLSVSVNIEKKKSREVIPTSNSDFTDNYDSTPE